MFDFIKRTTDRIRRRKRNNPEIIEAEIVEEKISEVKKSTPIRIGTIKFCSTHGTELPTNRVCPNCAEVAQKTDTRDPLNNDMNQDGMHGDHFDKRINQNKLLKDDCKEKPHNLLRKGYFCHRCEIMLWHRLTWCPRCGVSFDFIKMSSSEMGETFPDYIVGY